MAGPGLAIALLLVTLVMVSVTGFALSGDVRPRIQSRLNPLRYENEIREAAARHAVDPYLVAAVARAESGFDPAAVSSAGAVGLMQIMPATGEWIVRRDDWQGGPVGDLTDPAANLELGAFYLAFLIDLFGGDVRSALAAYNAGQGTVATWLDGAGDRRPSLEPADIPFPETRGFVERVERFRSIYRQAHPNAFRT
ncbi:MAG: lytic transglycosylase domain-containing protein [Thermoleophilia bacterium]